MKVNQPQNTRTRTRELTMAAMVAALYAVLSYFGSFFGLTYGPIQCRFAEALCVLPFLFPATAPGLFVGCLVTNLALAPWAGWISCWVPWPRCWPPSGRPGCPTAGWLRCRRCCATA